MFFAAARGRIGVAAAVLAQAVVAAAVVASATTTPAFASNAPLAPHVSPAKAAPYFDGRLLVRFDGSLATDGQARLIHAVGGRERRRLGAGVTLLDVPLGHVEQVAGVLRSLPGVRYAEPDYRQEPAAVPSDAAFGQQWAHQNVGQSVDGTSGTAGADERTAPAWSVTTGTPSVVVAVVDTGVDYTHPDLARNIWTNPGGVGGCPAGTHGFNVLSGGCDPQDDDAQYGGHGTHVAGIIGAVGDNGIGVAGVNWNTTIMPVKWVYGSGSAATSDLILGLDRVLTAKQAGVNVRVVNDSDVFVGTAYSQALSDEIDLLGSQGILFVTAAGNSGADNDAPASRRYPCAYGRDNEICVTASDQADGRPSWANYGSSTVDLAAPGANIYSTLRGGAYGYLSGGSMAAPQVSGAAALVLSRQDLSVRDLKATLLEHVDPLPTLSGAVRTGGRLDVCASVSGCAASGTPTAGTFGFASVGPSSDSMSADRKRANRYALDVPATVTSLSMYLAPTGTVGSQAVQGLIYADAGGVPGHLVASTASISFASSQVAGWYHLDFPGAVSLPAGTYWIGVISGGSANVAGFRWTSVAASRAANGNSFAAGPSDPFGVAASDAEQMSLYASYTTTAPPPGPPAPFAVTAPRLVAGAGPHPSPEPQVGQPVTGTTGTWDGSPTTYAFSWSRCSSAGTACTRLGSTAASYSPVASDVGSTLRVTVTATGLGGVTDSVSAPSLPAQQAAPSGSIGTSTIGANSDPATASWERVNAVQVANPGALTSVTIYLQRLTAGSQQFQGVLYADTAGAPGSLVAATAPQTITKRAASGWHSLPFSTPVKVATGTYWLGILAGPTSQTFALRYDESTAASGAVTPQSWASGPRNPFAAARLEAEKFSVYATWMP